MRDLASAFVTDPLEELEQIFEQSLRSLETEDVKSWWNNRKKLDAKLKVCLFIFKSFLWTVSWQRIIVSLCIPLRYSPPRGKITDRGTMDHGIAELIKKTLKKPRGGEYL